MDAFKVISEAHQKCLEHSLLTAVDKSYLENLRDDLEHDYGKGAQLRKPMLLTELARRLDLQRFDQNKLQELQANVGESTSAVLYLAGAIIYLMDNFQLIEDRAVFVK